MLKKNTNSESFKEKIYLLIIDKIIIGAIIACAFVFYDQIKEASDKKEKEETLKNQELFSEKMQLNQLKYDSLNHKTQATFQQSTLEGQKIQLEFERAKLAKEVWSIMTDTSKNIFTRAYTLKSAIATKAIDEGTGIDVAFRLYKEGLPSEDFIKIAQACMPNGISSIFQNVFLLALKYPKNNYSKPNEYTDESALRILRLQSACKEIISKSIQDLGSSSFNCLNNREYLSTHIISLFYIYRAFSDRDAFMQSNNSLKGIKVVGLINRILLGNNDKDAYLGLKQELNLKYDTQINIRYAQSILKIMSLYKTNKLDGDIAILISKIIVDPSFKFSNKTRDNSQLRSEHYWLQYDAAEFISESIKKTEAISGQSILIDFFYQFKSELDNSKDEKALEKLSVAYDDGVIVGKVIDIIREFKSQESIKVINICSTLDMEKLQYFPSLHQSIIRALFNSH